MPDFLVLVQLEGEPSSEIYTALHDLMFGMNLKLYVDLFDSKGNPSVYATPHATYYGVNIEGNASTVRDRVTTAVRGQIWDNIEVLVVQSADIATWAIPWKPKK
jgi:hypothetical protein